MPALAALEAWGRSMLTMTPPGSWKVRGGGGAARPTVYKDGWTTRARDERGVRASPGIFQGHRCVVFRSGKQPLG